MQFEIITKKIIIKQIAERWKWTYCSGSQWMRTSHDIYKKLKKLQLHKNVNILIKEINNIIGNDSWTNMKCDYCEKDVFKAIILNPEPDYETSSFLICEKCWEMMGECFKYNQP